MDFVVKFQELFLIMLIFPYPFYVTIVAFRQNNKNYKKQMIGYWILIFLLTYIKNKYNFPSINTFRTFLLNVIFIIWLQMPLFNGSAIFYNLLSFLLRMEKVPIQTDLGLGPLYDKAKENYKKVFVCLPQPAEDEDSSPSSDITTE